MTDSDDKTKRIVEKSLLEDSHCRMHRGLTDRNWGAFKVAVFIVAGALGSVATLAVKAVVDVRGQEERNIGQDKRIDDFLGLAKAMQETNTGIARSVGQMEGMWTAQMKGD